MAAPVAAAIVTVAKFIGGVKAIGIGVKIAAMVTPLIVGGLKMAAFSAVTKALSPKNKATGLASSGAQMSFKADTQAGVPFVLGRTGIGGNNIFQFPSGAANKYMNFFVVLGHGNGGPIEGIEGFRANNEAVTFNGSGRATSSSFAGKMWMTMALGLMPATALAVASDLGSGGSVAEWTSAHKLSGYAAARWTLEYDTKVYTSGVPQPEWVVKGIKVYDPRKDSTYPGGSGAHRLNNPATWEFSENPYIHGLNYCLGYFANGKRVGGAGATIDMLDVPAFIEGANVADANGWKVGGVVTSLDSKWGALKAILQAGSGEPVPAGAKISVRVDTPRSSLAVLTEADIAGPVSAPAVRTRRDRKNAIIPRYRSEAHNWEIVSAAPVTSTTYQTEDGGLRQKEVEYTLCQSAAQAAQLAAYDLVNAREIEPITLSVKPAWQGFRVSDCITIDLPERGFVNRKAVIIQRSLDLKTGVVTLACVSETDAKHAFALGQSPFPPPTPGLTPPDFANVPAPGIGAFVIETSEAISSGLTGSSLLIVGANDYAFTAQIVVKFRPVGATEFAVYNSFPATQTRFLITGLVEGNFYDFAVSYISIRGVHGPDRVLTSNAPGLQPVIFTDVKDGDTLVFDPPMSGVPTVFEVDMTGCLAAPPGDTQIYRVTDLTASGAVVALKISDNTETTSHESQAATIDVNGYAVAVKPSVADAYNGLYTFTVTVARRQPHPSAPWYSFAPIMVRPAGAAYPSGLVRIGEVGGSASGPVKSATQGPGNDIYTVTLPCSVALGLDGGSQFYAVNTGQVGTPQAMVVEYDTEVSSATESPATDATHGATVAFYPPGYTGAPTGSGIYFDNAAVASLPVASSPEIPTAEILVSVAGVRKKIPYASLPSGGGGDPDPYALSNIDSQGGAESDLDTALAFAQANGIPLTGNSGTVTITAAKMLTGCSIDLRYKSLKFGANLASVLTTVNYTHGSTGAPIALAVVGPAVELGGATPSNSFYSKTIRLIGDYTGNGANQSAPFTAARIQTDQPARSAYDIALQNHRGDGLEINSDTEKKVIDYTFDHIYEGYALAFRTTSSSFSPDEVVVNMTGTFCSNLLFAQDAGQFSYRVNFNVENVLPWAGTYAVDDYSRKGTCYAGEIRSPIGDLIKIETRGSGYSSGGPTVVFDSLRIIQHYCGRITIINPKSVGGTIYHDQVDNSRTQSTNTTAYRNSLTAGQPTFLTDQPAFQIGAVLENCTLTYVTRRNVCPYGARIGISDWVNPIAGTPDDPSPQEAGSPFNGKSIRLEIQMGDRNIDSVDADGNPLMVTASFSGTTFTVTAGEALVVGQFLKASGLPLGLRVTAVGGGGVYTVNRTLTTGSMQVAAGATPDMFYAIWADHGEGSTIWANGNLAGNILISKGWQRGTIHVSAAWVRAGYTVDADPLATTELVIHGPMDLPELDGIAWAFKGCKILHVNDFDGAGAYYNGTHWMPLSPPLVPQLSLEAMGSPYNAPFIKRKGLSAVNSGNALPYYATGPLTGDVWQTPGGTSITPQWDAATSNFESRAGGFSTAYKLAFDRFIYDLRLAGVYTGNSATSKIKGFWPLIGPSDAAAKNNLLFDFWDLDVQDMEAHQPGIGYVPYTAPVTFPVMEVVDWADDGLKYGTSGQNLMILASCGVLLNSAQSSVESGGPYFTAGGNTEAFRVCFHRVDGGNHAQMNASDAYKVVAPSQGNSGLDYRIGMGWTPDTTSQSIRMYGGPTVTAAKVVSGGGSAPRIFFGKAHDYRLRIPIELAGLGSGDFTPDEAAATLAAVNTLRSALLALA